ncbi:MAG: carbamoyltransferase C-terminal domain-containing protein [Elusimicrobiota bacterium]
MSLCIGLNKGSHGAGICLVDGARAAPRAQLFLKERITRAKPEEDWTDLSPVIGRLPARVDAGRALIAENSFGERPLESIDARGGKAAYRRHWLYSSRKSVAAAHGRKAGRVLGAFNARTNPRVEFLPHHYCHAVAAMTVSPFRKALIVVMDGAGNFSTAFDPAHPELLRFPPPPSAAGGLAAEAVSIYAQDGARLTCLHKDWQSIRPSPPHLPRPLTWGDGLGLFYENAAVFIFGNSRHAGKVMGLAALGRPRPVKDRLEFFEALDWTKSFRGSGADQWEASPHRRYYADIAASVQAHFERSVLELMSRCRKSWPEYSRLILTGGCALNCLTNSRIARSGLFRELYVPPFPGDESIAFGAAHHLARRSGRARWKPVPWKRQKPNWGPAASIPSRRNIRAVFGRRARAVPNPAATAADLLARGKVVAWFQDRSESGPRALGFRSLLADPLRPGIKNYLNGFVKDRESFRPYGCSVLWEKAGDYFSVSKGFDSPFMSFAPTLRRSDRCRLREISHVDGTSRIQTVRREQNPLFYDLIKRFGDRTGVYAVLNTSLNVRGEPIAETLEDARRVLDLTPIDALVAGSFLVAKDGAAR